MARVSEKLELVAGLRRHPEKVRPERLELAGEAEATARNVEAPAMKLR